MLYVILIIRQACNDYYTNPNYHFSLKSLHSYLIIYYPILSNTEILRTFKHTQNIVIIIQLHLQLFIHMHSRLVSHETCQSPLLTPHTLSTHLCPHVARVQLPHNTIHNFTWVHNELWTRTDVRDRHNGDANRTSARVMYSPRQ